MSSRAWPGASPSVLAMAVGCLALAGCADGPTEPMVVVPPEGPNFSVLPVPIDSLARVIPLGSNNKIFPTSHTYWLTCDVNIILQGTRPCHRALLPILAPAAGIVNRVDPADDGFIRVEGPPGLKWVFGHVTPTAGLVEGTPVTAGQVIATMFFEHGFDFGVVNAGVTNEYLSPERYIEEFLHGQNPIAQFPEPLRSDLIDRVNTFSDPMGRLAYDVAGTASGGWFEVGAPTAPGVLFSDAGAPYLLFLGRWVERQETRVVSAGEPWPGMPAWQIAADPGAPDWEDITPASGMVAVKLWNISVDATPNVAGPEFGTFLLQLLDATTLRAEWFDTHDPVTAFTAAARTYGR